jgi:DNA-binding CsgD family transcriptional regulator
MTNGRDIDPSTSAPIAITLSAGQIDYIVSEAFGDRGLRGVIGGRMDDLGVAVGEVLADPEWDDGLLSRSTLMALQVFCAFAPAGTERGASEVAAELDLSASTAQRYLQTLLRVRLLEWSSETRCYCIPPSPAPAGVGVSSSSILGEDACARAALPHPSGVELLTPREAEVLEHLRRGQSNAQIALALCVTVETVRTHVAHIRSKLGVHSRVELVER